MSKATNALIGFLAGAAAGAVVGILYAPDKGYKTRKKIKKQAINATEDLSDSVNDTVEDLRDYVDDVVSDMRAKFGHIESNIKNRTNKAEGKAKETIK
ncbi:MAG: YtxH domain-containing protein [Bacteroidota bacterium]